MEGCGRKREDARMTYEYNNSQTYPEANRTQLIDSANRGMGGTGAVVEAMFRLSDTIKDQEKVTKRLNKILIWLTLVIAIGTVVLVMFEVSPRLRNLIASRLDYRPKVVSQELISPEKAYARQLLKGLSPDDVIRVCGKPSSDYVGDYGDYKWRIVGYGNFEANFILKEGRWQYDFMSDGHGRVLPDGSAVTRPVTIRLPCKK
jgi:hypothetical protein